MHGVFRAWGTFKWNTTDETFVCQGGEKQGLEGQREIEKRKMGGNTANFFNFPLTSSSSNEV